jgi:hypothetical protein
VSSFYEMFRQVSIRRSAENADEDDFRAFVFGNGTLPGDKDDMVSFLYPLLIRKKKLRPWIYQVAFITVPECQGISHDVQDHVVCTTKAMVPCLIALV